MRSVAVVLASILFATPAASIPNVGASLVDIPEVVNPEDEVANLYLDALEQTISCQEAFSIYSSMAKSAANTKGASAEAQAQATRLAGVFTTQSKLFEELVEKELVHHAPLNGVNEQSAAIHVGIYEYRQRKLWIEKLRGAPIEVVRTTLDEINAKCTKLYQDILTIG